MVTFAMGFSSIMGQTITLTGTVLDGESGDPLIGATVFENGGTNGVSTNLDGSYSIKVATVPATLKFSFIGYETVTRTIENAAPIVVKLNVDAEMVGEVVVVGYGRQKKKVSTGSISKVTAKASRASLYRT